MFKSSQFFFWAVVQDRRLDHGILQWFNQSQHSRARWRRQPRNCLLDQLLWVSIFFEQLIALQTKFFSVMISFFIYIKQLSQLTSPAISASLKELRKSSWSCFKDQVYLKYRYYLPKIHTVYNSSKTTIFWCPLLMIMHVILMSMSDCCIIDNDINLEQQ